MSSVCIFPPIDNISQLRDLASRIAWHFEHVNDAQFVLPVTGNHVDLSKLAVPEGFDDSISRALPGLLERMQLIRVNEPTEALPLLDDSEVILKRVQDIPWVEQALKGRKTKIFRVDHERVRQEGSFYIEAAFSLISNKNELIRECKDRFLRLKSETGRTSKSWVLATGPSVEAFREFDFEGALTIACNSTILNDELMERAKPRILVFADPIFHFGVSQYAGAFRDAVRRTLESTDITVIVPFKYYPLLVSKFPEYRERIIGIPFGPREDFNLDIGNDFELKVTSNILTLLLLPLASTFSDEIHLIGCDGRPLDADDYFWGHGASVQISSKMENIKQIHPGFFDIDYNEYYFEHCHVLENLIEQGEALGKRYTHDGASHIPALKKRRHPGQELDLDSAKETDSDLCVLLEPDGIGTAGHYVVWHNQLAGALSARNTALAILCNRKQDVSLYDVPAHTAITSHSWAVSRSDFSFQRNFTAAPTYVKFRDELLAGLRSLCDGYGARQISLFVYYGSTQILKAIQEVRRALIKDGIALKATLCLFHESVILDNKRSEPKFPPNAKEILMEAVAQTNAYRILAVTDELGGLIYRRFGVKMRSLPNPIPGRSDASSHSIAASDGHVDVDNDGGFSIVFPCRLRPEKGGDITLAYLHALGDKYISSQGRVAVRGAPLDAECTPSETTFIGDDISEDEYWSHLRNSHVVVIPYLAPQFTYRTSGIIVDALYAGKPCIVMEGTWLASVVGKLRSGLAIRYHGPESIASAVSAIRENYPFFRKNAAAAYTSYSQQNSWNAVTQTIFS